MEKEWAVLKIDENRMWVTLAIKCPEGEENISITSDYIAKYLKENGIKIGIDQDAIDVLASGFVYDQDIEVARGKRPINGKNGFYEFVTETEVPRSKPIINPDGSVDYNTSLKIATIKEGELIAVYKPATGGEFGYTVFAEMLQPVHGKDLRPLKGKGFLYDEETGEYRAAYEGRIIKSEGRLDVERLLIVDGDLDIETGDISFNGDVEVKGDVRSGLKIEAQGDVLIHGHVGACDIKAGKNVTIRKGVQGRNKCNIEAKQNVVCSFVERCTIVAGADIYADSVLDSYIKAYNQVIVTSKKGNVVGGITAGMQGICVKEAGNATGVNTEFVLGVFKEKLDRYAELGIALQDLEKEIADLKKHLRLYECADGQKRSKHVEELRIKVLRMKVMKDTEFKKLKEEFDELNENIEMSKENAVFEIKGVAHSGIKVISGGTSLEQKDTWKEIKYKLINYKLRMLVGDEIQESGT